jgi:MoaA/NifB/PqqE/SkfB family radical SAM enzyme
MKGVLRSWRAILMGRRPAMSIEITRECPLSCPGCYAYNDNHLGEGVGLRDVTDFRGDALVERVLALVRADRPLHVSFVGGEPLVRYRELSRLLPILSKMGIHTQVVTSAVRPVPPEWAAIRKLDVSVSIDGLQPEHDARRKPATYDRILRHIEGHHITVHCTITRQMAQRPGDIERFVRFWSDVPAVKRIWVSLYTPQVGELSVERLSSTDRARVIGDLGLLAPRFRKLGLGPAVLAALASPPSSPDQCIFAKVTRCVSADLQRTVTPCQFGGRPDCTNCGCMASAGLSALGRHRLPGGLALGTIFDWSLRVGARAQRLREAVRERFPAKTPVAGKTAETGGA